MTTTYDTALLEQIAHLKKYPNYLPYISAKYTEAPLKILIVGESHYLNEKYDDQVDANTWYDDHENLSKRLKDDLSGTNTRLVIADYKGNNRTLKAYRIFLNLEAAYRQVFADRTLFNECAFINYFQRPAERNGGSINASERDHNIAYENISVLIATLHPDKIIFVSRKAFDSYKRNVLGIDYKK